MIQMTTLVVVVLILVVAGFALGLILGLAMNAPYMDQPTATGNHDDDFNYGPYDP